MLIWERVLGVFVADKGWTFLPEGFAVFSPWVVATLLLSGEWAQQVPESPNWVRLWAVLEERVPKGKGVFLPLWVFSQLSVFQKGNGHTFTRDVGGPILLGHKD